MPCVPLTLLALLPLSLMDLGVYQWTDPQGVSHYSDQRPSGAQPHQVIEVTPSPAVTSPNLVHPSHLIPATNQPETLPAPLPLTLIAPQQGSTVRDNQGHVRVAVRPPNSSLPPFDMQVYLDGRVREKIHNQLVFQMENVDRGAHQLSVELLREDGTILAKSSPVTFYLHRAHLKQAPAKQP